MHPNELVIWINMFVSAILAITYIGVYIRQKKLISELKHANTAIRDIGAAQTGLINNLKTYTDIIDIEKLKQYVQLSLDTQKMELKKESIAEQEQIVANYIDKLKVEKDEKLNVTEQLGIIVADNEKFVSQMAEAKEKERVSQKTMNEMIEFFIMREQKITELINKINAAPQSSLLTGYYKNQLNHEFDKFKSPAKPIGGDRPRTLEEDGWAPED